MTISYAGLACRYPQPAYSRCMGARIEATSEPKRAVQDHSWIPGLLQLTLCFWLAMVIYALSPGPVMKFCRSRGSAPPACVEMAYAPLDSMYRHSPAFKKFYDWYLHRLWRIK